MQESQQEAEEDSGPFQGFHFGDDQAFDTELDVPTPASKGDDPSGLLASMMERLKEEAQATDRELAKGEQAMEARDAARIKLSFFDPLLTPFASARSKSDHDLVLAGARFRVVDNPGGGDCFFHAVAAPLQFKPEKSAKMRQEACDYLEAHQELFRLAPLEDEEIPAFIARMRLPGVYAEGALIYAVAEKEGVHLSIFVMDGHGYVNVEPEHINSALGLPKINLLLKGQHYLWLRSREVALQEDVTP